MSLQSTHLGYLGDLDVSGTISDSGILAVEES